MMSHLVFVVLGLVLLLVQGLVSGSVLTFQGFEARIHTGKPISPDNTVEHRRVGIPPSEL